MRVVVDRAFQHYTSCVRDIVDSCPHGVQLLYDFDNRLRTYNSRMEYICNEVKDGRTRSVKGKQNAPLKGNKIELCLASV